MLQNEAAQSAQLYLDYLNAHKDEGLGMVRARVVSCQGSLISREMLLTTDRVIRSAEGLVLRIGGTVYENTPEAEHYRILSINRRRVIIEPSPALAEEIECAIDNKEQVILESDLTFLVKRVKNWYEKHGARAELPAAGPACRLDPQNPIALSDNQYDCAALAMASPLAYIWGAPGTGKTRHVLASCILSYIRAGRKVILVAPTNNALEQSLDGLLWALSGEGGIRPAGKVVRLGVPGDLFRTIWPDICEDGALDWLKAELTERIGSLDERLHTVQDSMACKEAGNAASDPFPEKSVPDLLAEKKRLMAEKNDLLAKSRKITESRSIMPMLSTFSVVASTVDTCIYRISPDGIFKPDHVFLDEAGYCNVLKGMTLLGFGKPLTLLGDHMQLPPVFEGETDLINDPAKKLTRLWMMSSLYIENAVRSGDLDAFCTHMPDRPHFDRMQVGVLTETHRFGPELAGILAERIYGSRFCSWSMNETKILYINAPKSAADLAQDETGKPGRISHSEVKCARSLMENNLNHPGVTVGIITPYRKQRRLLADTMERLMKKYRMEDSDIEDDIVTVHQSQGREWDIVLFSITDCYHEMYFTNSRRREGMKLINTAVSRAKKMLILIGDTDSWKGKTGQLISEILAVGKEISAKDTIAATASCRCTEDDSYFPEAPAFQQRSGTTPQKPENPHR